MGSGVLTSQPTEEIEETMETGLIPLMEHRTYCTRKHKRVSDRAFSPSCTSIANSNFIIPALW